ncbi:MAG: hypothetical protein HQ527_01085 [Cyanobacteria bacterium]|nr:hypothetical protein [Cyanobacteria bacterium bin.51]
MAFRIEKEGFPYSDLQDWLGGVWERQVFVQGNALFPNKANGYRIFVPLPAETNWL